MSISSDDLGKMGEHAFKMIAKQAGFTANSSDDDKGGWDVEIEEFRGQNFNFSNHSYFVGRIQVKSALSEKAKVSMTFSNLLNLIQYPGAAFIAYFEFEAENLQPTNTYLRLVDEALSREILVALRKSKLKNANFKINKNTFTVKFLPIHLMTSFSGETLKQNVFRMTGENHKEYVGHKTNYLRSFEKESDLWGVSMSIDGGEDNINQFIDALLGYDVTFKGNSSMYLTTMGVPDNKLKDDTAPTSLSLSPVEDNQPKVEVLIGFEPYGKRYKFAGCFFSTPSFIPQR